MAGIRVEDEVDTPMVLLHGGGVGPWMWDLVKEHLPAERDVLTPTLDGHGSASRPTFTGNEAAATAVAREVEGSFGTQRITLVGFSLGGQVALRLAASRALQLRRLVLISTLLEPLPAVGPAVALVRMSAPLARRPWFARMQAAQLGVPPEMFDAYMSSVESVSPETLANVTRANATFDGMAQIERVSAPLGLLCGGKEPAAVRRGMQRASAVTGAALRIVAGAGHTLPLTHPDVVATAITGVGESPPPLPQ